MRQSSNFDDRGAVTTWFVVMTIPMLLMAGLVFDGGRVLSERRESLDVAQNAARAGAQAVDLTVVRSGGLVVSASDAETAASNYLSANGFTGIVSVAGDTVTVTVTQEVEMKMLTSIGIRSRTVSGTASAHIVQGIEGPDS
ncbi:MAG: TadE/TadG family type IV pilus assembly protein [Acidimicrobiales bacterium]